jgi:DHA2 family methylenomycin A resistance protein-like MFS transporter
VGIAVAVGFAFVVGYYGLPFVMSPYLQQVRGLTSPGAGAAFLPTMGIGLLLTPLSARLVERLGARPLITAGLFAMTTGLALHGLAPASGLRTSLLIGAIAALATAVARLLLRPGQRPA